MKKNVYKCKKCKKARQKYQKEYRLKKKLAWADLSNATAITIKEIRKALQT